MEKEMIVQKFIKAFEGEFNEGIISGGIPRQSDCFVLYTKGSADYCFEDVTLKVKSGDSFFIPKGSIYRININEKSRYVCINFDFTPAKTKREPALFKEVGSLTEGMFLRLLRLRAEGINMPKALSLVYGIYFELLKLENKKYSHVSDMDKIYSAINERISDPDLSISDISAKTGISEPKLRREIKSALHVPPIKYVTDLRLEKSRLMLCDSNLSVSETAYACGFDDPFYFSRCFKKRYGISPRDFRAEQQQKK